MIRGVITAVLVAGIAGAGGWAFVDQSRQADATTITADAGPSTTRGDRLDIAMPAVSPEAHIQRAYAKVMADNASSRFMTVALPRGPQTTDLMKVPPHD